MSDSELKNELAKARLENLELQTELNTEKRLNRSLYSVVNWLREHRPEVWEDIKRFMELEREERRERMAQRNTYY